MTEVDLTGRMARLNQTVASVQSLRAVEAEATKAQALAERQAKWDLIQAEAPEVADMAKAVRAVFPGSRLVKVVIGGKRVI